MTEQLGFALSPQQAALDQADLVGGVMVVAECDEATVGDALRRACERHEILRTSFVAGPGEPMQVVSERAGVAPARIERRGEALAVVWEAPARQLDELSLSHLMAELARDCAGGPVAEPLQYADYAGWVLEAGGPQCVAGRGRRTARTGARPLPPLGLSADRWWQVTGIEPGSGAVLVDARDSSELPGAVGPYLYWQGPPMATVGFADIEAPDEDSGWRLVESWSTAGPPLVLRLQSASAWIEYDPRWCAAAEAEELLAITLSDRHGTAPVGPDLAQLAQGLGHGLTLSDGSRTWAPVEVRLRVRQVAAAVRGLAAGHQEPAVLLAARPGLEAVVGLLGIWAAGAVAVPVDGTGPSQRVAAQLDLVAPVTVLSDAPGDWPATVVVIGRDAPLWSAGAPALVQPPPGPPGALAATMFTSGTSGRPKGVDVPNGALCSYARSLVQRVRPGPGSSWCLVTPLTADLGFTSLLAALWTSGTLVVAPDVEADLSRAQWAKITPRHLELLLDTATDPANRLPAVGVVIGGEQWSTALADRLHRLRPDLCVINHYGPTETAVGVLVHELQVGEPGPHPPLGAPLGHVRLAVAAEPGEPRGELVIGGPSVARGYRGQPRLTADRFRPDPDAVGQRAYWTGDLVVRTEGRLFHVGRRDAQLSVNGYRVEPGEVESALAAHPAILQAAVTTADSGMSLAALLVAAPGTAAPSLSALRASLVPQLPAAMIPASLTWVPALPRTASGKLDRGALPGMVSAAKLTHEPPASPAEATLAAVVGDVLGIGPVGATDDFFALGGDSIKSLQLVSRARAAGLTLTPRDVFEHPTVRAMAGVATAELAAGRALGPGGTAAQVAPVAEPPGPVPLLPAAAEFLARGGPDPQHYNQAFWLHAGERLSAAAVRGALAALVERHDALRTAFRPGLAGWRAEVVRGRPEVPLVEVDLTADPEPQAAAAALAAAAQRTFVLGRPPLMTCALVRIPAGDQLLWIAHHLVVDAVSWQVLFEQFQRAYLQLRAGVAVDLGPATASHRAWANAVARLGHPPTLPAARGAVADTTSIRSVVDPAGTADLLDRTAPDLGVAPAAAIVGLIGVAVRLVEPDRAVLGLEVELHGRDLVPDLDAGRTVGWLTSRARLAVPLKGEPRELLAGAARTLAVPAPGQPEGAEPAIGLTYLGRSARAFPPGSPFTTFAEMRVGVRAPSTPVRNELDVAAEVVDGRLVIDWTALPGARDWAQALADALPEALARLVEQRVVAGAAAISVADLDSLLAQWQAEGFG